jgi:hypothetical protein
VVFLIGFRVNSLRALRQWIPVAKAMGPMLRELMADPDSGLLAFRTLPGCGKSQAYQGNIVGIWHETYVVPARNSETIYTNMPLLGLGQVSRVAPVNTRGGTAAERLGTHL